MVIPQSNQMGLPAPACHCLACDCPSPHILTSHLCQRPAHCSPDLFVPLFSSFVVRCDLMAEFRTRTMWSPARTAHSSPVYQMRVARGGCRGPGAAPVENPHHTDWKGRNKPVCAGRLSWRVLCCISQLQCQTLITNKVALLHYLCHTLPQHSRHPACLSSPFLAQHP